MFCTVKPEFYCLEYCSGTQTALTVLTVLSVFLKRGNDGTVVMSQFYIQPRAGFYLYCTEEK